MAVRGSLEALNIRPTYRLGVRLDLACDSGTDEVKTPIGTRGR
ncbi:MAG: hypothetical protein JWO77_3547 [Ilumatobacteraceae bacterium]|nr:hypothetical protein [Ilumatobacteraceae bacterium]